ncbi:hypothetical protein [Saccharothrix algeriensis]|uniref:DnaJ-class molecular chaperone n=1 Tax=Saccharothrix algeriensis TaxID=173560 RepID=A0A8T8HUC4_9PSEU|nr:hypothetical protein [Saccharothrix algeriensis]MBM7813692.1 DnaJ-class molecular chaperone [Saccharothrix algeriensis]QTR02163.1 hypothetical protein J7S33_23600 [Saccharothrix algeriensis]
MECPSCNGDGIDPWFAGTACDECEGHGEVDAAAYPELFEDDEFDSDEFYD